MQQTIMLNKEQKEAAEHMGSSLLIYAGAGAGKTRVIVQRIAYLIEKQGVPPYNILAITFTNKAANEMKERVAIALNNEQHGVTIRTFHSLCVLLLRRFGDKIGFDRNFIILDDDDQIKVIKEVLKDLNLSVDKHPPRQILGVIGERKASAISSDKYESLFTDANFFENVFIKVYKAYQIKIRQNNCMDFDDLILHTIHLFEKDEEVRKYVNQRFQFIHVDEYQDTNKAQFKLLELLGKGNYVCAVGDTDQAIYSWRGADIRNINEFENDFQQENKPVKIVKLTQNYRSTQVILDAANKLISNNSDRKPKELWTSKEGGDKIEIIQGEDDRDEVANIVATIRKVKNEKGYEYSDFAILYRINAMSRYLETALLNSSIPYKVVGNLSFYKRKEIKDLIAFMRLLINENDDISFERAITCISRGIGSGSLEKLSVFASENNVSNYQAIEIISSCKTLTENFKKKFTMFKDEIENMKSRLHSEGIEKVISIVTNESGYIVELQDNKKEDSTSKLENIDELKNSVAHFFDDIDELDLEELGYDMNNPLDLLALYVNNVMLDAGDVNIDTTDAITLMSAHKAKGTEYKCVIVCAFEQGLFPMERATSSIKEFEEERRLAYVAFTRAKEKLYISIAHRRPRHGKYQNSRPSPFIEEAGLRFLSRYGFNNFSLSHRKRDEFNKADKNTDYRDFSKSSLHKKAIQSSVVSNNESNWKSGEKVEHEKFGKGIIVNVGSDLLTIAFNKEYGIKKILSTHIALKKI